MNLEVKKLITIIIQSIIIKITHFVIGRRLIQYHFLGCVIDSSHLLKSNTLGQFVFIIMLLGPDDKEREFSISQSGENVVIVVSIAFCRRRRRGDRK